jgi:hypothetical protein
MEPLPSRIEIPESIRVSEVQVTRVYPEAAQVITLVGLGVLVLMAIVIFFIKPRKRK